MKWPGITGEQLALLVQHSPMLIWRAGLDAGCDYFNETWLEFTGRPLAQELGDGWADGVHAGDLGRCLSIYRDHFARRQPFTMEYRLRRHDGQYRYVLDRGVPFSDDDGQFGGFVGGCIDIHDRRELDRQRAQFHALIAHELRTPLTSMATIVETIRRKGMKAQPVGDEMYERFNAQVDRLAALIEDLSEVATLEEGRELPVTKTRVDLAAIVRDVVVVYRDAAEARSAERRPTFAVAGLDEGADGCFVMGDRRRLEQVLGNVLDNAMKYSPHGGEIAVTLAVADGRARLVVSDRGIGIPTAELAAVGRRYYRATNAAMTNYPGLGLGLSLCKELVERHDGQLTVTSTLDEGTTVAIDLPVVA
ncbi:MAG TPA: PAS domain-containing sensor histidine kinase [Polyangia bacterium]|nr:PAS domain-containing sensor histidine kinase [Polyangia bacterium]